MQWNYYKVYRKKYQFKKVTIIKLSPNKQKIKTIEKWGRNRI